MSGWKDPYGDSGEIELEKEATSQFDRAIITFNKNVIPEILRVLVIKPMKLLGSLIILIPIVLLAAIVMSYPKDSMSYDNYKERMTNASEEEKIFATNSTLDEVADHKIEGGELVNLGEEVVVSDEEKDLIRENYIINEDSGSEVKVQQFSDGSTVTKENGSQVTVWETEEKGDQA